MEDTPLPIPTGETAVVPDPALDEFKADELSPSSMDSGLAPVPPTGEVVPDVDTQQNLVPEPEPEEPAAPAEPAVQPVQP